MYIFYKYFKQESQWNLESIRLDGCRFVTDFGVELISYATRKQNLISKNFCCGCKKIIKYINQPVRLDYKNEDLFLSDTFNKCNNSSSEKAKVLLNTYKIMILNDTEFNMTTFIEHKKSTKNRKIINFTQFNIESKSHSDKLKFNILEIDSVSFKKLKKNILRKKKQFQTFFEQNFPYALNTPSSILMIVLDYASNSEFVKSLTNKLLQNLYKVMNNIDLVNTL